MKRYILRVLILGVCLLAISTTSLASLTGFDQQLENHGLILHLNSTTTEIAVEQKSTGAIWYSNPVNRSQDKVARGTAADQLNSQLTLVYYTPEDLRQTMNSYRNSVLLEQFEIKKLARGFRVEYMFGEQWKADDGVPVMISEARMEEKILSQLATEEDRAFVLNQYNLVHIVPAPEGYERVSILNVDKEQLFGEGNMLTIVGESLTGTARRNLIQSVMAHIVNNREAYSGRQQLRPEDFSHFKEGPVYVLKDKIRAWDWTALLDVVKSAGYTPVDTQFDHQAHRIDPPVENIRVFQLAIEYTLDGDDLIVTVPAKDIVFPEDVMDRDRNYRKVDYPLTAVNILPYFGAADQHQEGYIFVPDGSGALITLNKNKLYTQPYEKLVYGRDFSVTPVENMPHPGEQIYLPVFGLKQEGLGFLAIIESGDALARIQADVAGRTSSYNNVYANFNLRPFSQLKMKYDDTTTTLNLFQLRMYQGDIRIRYKFLLGEEATYIGMAHAYQDYLVNKHNLSLLNNQSLPLMIEMIAAVDHREPVLGVPRQVVYPMTSYQQMRSFVDLFLNKAVNNLKLRYSGWLSGGIRHLFPEKVKLEKQLGSVEDWQALLDFTKEKNISFYPDVSFLQVYRDGLFDDFKVKSDAARFLNRRTAHLYTYNPATYQRKNAEEPYILSPRRLSSLIESFNQDYTASSLSLRDYGQMLNADYRLQEHNLVDRQQARQLVEEEIKKLSVEQDYDLLVDGANAYVLPYAHSLVNIPLFTSSLYMLDQGVPFLPIVLHGYWTYAGEPINLAANPKKTILKTLEVGASPYYLGAMADSSILKRTNFDYLYAVYYQDWVDQALDFYQKANSLLAQVEGTRIVNHQRLAPEVFQTTYENGVAIIVNYNDFPVNVNGVLIEGEGFVSVKDDFYER